MTEALNLCLANITSEVNTARTITPAGAVDGDTDIIDHALDTIEAMVDVIRQCDQWLTATK